MLEDSKLSQVQRKALKTAYEASLRARFGPKRKTTEAANHVAAPEQTKTRKERLKDRVRAALRRSKAT
jgi:hypothetical protein